jgi:hypothetical protein
MFATAVELIEKSSSVGLTGQFERDRNANRSRRSCLEPPSFEGANSGVIQNRIANALFH